jgi:hypothetical protein
MHLMLKIWPYTILIAAVSVCGCNKFRNTQSNNRGIATNLKVATTLNEFGVETALIKAGLNVGQDVNVAIDNTVAGTAVSFPSRSIATDTYVTIEEAASIATAATASQLKIGENIAGKGIAVAILSIEGTDPVLPYTITLPAPPAPELLLQEEALTLVVFYKMTVVATEKILLGLIPFAKLKFEGNLVKFSAPHFGAFQAAYTNSLITEAKEITVTAPIQTKREVLELVPFEITGRKPFIVSAGNQVTVTGTGFRPTMVMSFGGSKVINFRVETENSLSFYPPLQSKFGITDLTANQDGIEQTISVLYRGTKTDLPLITLSEPEVCSEYKYYDIDGTERTGTRGCGAAAASLTANNCVDHSNSSLLPTCSRDGQLGCVTTERFKSADSEPSVISPWDIRHGKTLAGIRGKLKFCKNSARQIISDESNAGTAIGFDYLDPNDDTVRRAAGTSDESLFEREQACDATVWQAGGIDSGSNPGACNDDEDQCTYEDLLTGLTWSKANIEPVPWVNAVTYCTGTLAGYSDWRSPTLNELNQAAIDGIDSVSSPNFIITDNKTVYWSATTNSSLPTQAWTVDLAGGTVESLMKTKLRRALCVRR